jgi:hypothetical protein
MQTPNQSLNADVPRAGAARAAAGRRLDCFVRRHRVTDTARASGFQSFCRIVSTVIVASETVTATLGERIPHARETFLESYNLPRRSARPQPRWPLQTIIKRLSALPAPLCLSGADTWSSPVIATTVTPPDTLQTREESQRSNGYLGILWVGVARLAQRMHPIFVFTFSQCPSTHGSSLQETRGHEHPCLGGAFATHPIRT